MRDALNRGSGTATYVIKVEREIVGRPRCRLDNDPRYQAMHG